MSIAPFERTRTRSAMRSADMPGPGSRLGHEVTIFHFTVCARATEGIAIAPARAAAAERRVILLMASSPVRVKMMQRAVAVADLEPVGGRDRGVDVGFRGPHRRRQI